MTMEKYEEVHTALLGKQFTQTGGRMGSLKTYDHAAGKICMEVDEATGVIRAFRKVGSVREYDDIPEAADAIVAELYDIAGGAPEQEAEEVDAELMGQTPPTNENTSLSTLPAIDGCGIVRPMVSATQAKEVWDEFQALKRAIIEPSDLQNISGKSFVKKSGWRKLANAFNLSDEIIEEVRQDTPDGKGYQWTIKVKAIAPNGRSCVGVAKCDSSEKSGARKEHDTYTTAHTRAKNRAISDLIAAGEVSAEEMK